MENAPETNHITFERFDIDSPTVETRVLEVRSKLPDGTSVWDVFCEKGYADSIELSKKLNDSITIMKTDSVFLVMGNNFTIKATLS